VRELAVMIVGLSGARASIVEQPLPEDDPRRRRPDISRAIELLDWQPKMPLEEGLQTTIDYFRAELAAGVRTEELVVAAE
jgi:UDP-glucuronate decarboxylase